MIKKRNLLGQKIVGFLFVLISIILVVKASRGVTVEERDCTAVLITLPIGFYMLFSRGGVII
jgi:hypothetical protein